MSSWILVLANGSVWVPACSFFMVKRTPVRRVFQAGKCGWLLGRVWAGIVGRVVCLEWEAEWFDGRGWGISAALDARTLARRVLSGAGASSGAGF